MEVLVVVDLQNDFIDGSLGNPGNDEIVEPIIDLIENFNGEVLFTRDTHHEDYLDTLEGKLLPIIHCQEGTHGWEIRIDTKDHKIFNKETFGSYDLVNYLLELNKTEPIDKVTLVGICTDICVVSNALLIRNAFPNTPVEVIADLCKGTNEENHKASLQTMASTQIAIK